MSKITIVGYHHLQDGFLGASKAFEQLGYVVDFFPLLSYKSDGLDEDTIKKDLIGAINGHLNNVRYSTKVTEYESFVVLWWNFNVTEDFVKTVKESTKSALHIFYSWDDPYSIEKAGSLNRKFSYIDICFTCCAKSVDYYLLSGAKRAYYLPPGFDKNVHKYEKDDRFECDVSIVCTNLYDFDDKKHINRKKFLDDIINDGTIDLHIYGNELFKDIYPDHYKGFINFKNSNKVFSNSKININTHIRKNGNMYINERTCQILGSRGLLYIDDINGLDNVINRITECVVIDEDNHVKQIKDILNNYDLYEKVKENGHQLALKHYTWNIFANNINQYILSYCKENKIDIKHDIKLVKLDDAINVNKINLEELYDLLCSIYYSNYSIKNKLNILHTIVDKYHIDLDLFMDLNFDKIAKDRFSINFR